MNQPYPNTQFTATGGAQPYTWSVNPALPNGLTLNPSSGVTSGTPLSGSHGNSTHAFTVTDSTTPINQQGQRTLALTIYCEWHACNDHDGLASEWHGRPILYRSLADSLRRDLTL